jgi:hypothetical protein
MNTDTTAQVEWIKSAANVASAGSASKGFVFYDVERYEGGAPLGRDRRAHRARG